MVKGEGRAVPTKVHHEQRPGSENQGDVLRGIIRSSTMVKAQGVRARDGVRGFLTFTKDLNYARLCLLLGFMSASPPLSVLLLSPLYRYKI